MTTIPKSKENKMYSNIGEYAKAMTDQELLAAITAFSNELNPVAQNYVTEYKKEFLARREAELPGSSDIEIENYAGRLLNPFAMFDEDFENLGEQLSVTLPRVGRFWHQTREKYSVAQHCLSMVELFEGDIELQRIAIVHEAFEGPWGDIPTPLKRMFPQIKAAENRALESISRIYGLPWPYPAKIKEADTGLMVMEALCLMSPNSPTNWRQKSQPMGKLYKLGADEAEIASDFRQKFNELFPA
jgi:hypothetical protein